MPEDIDPSKLLTLSEALGTLPNLKPRKAYQLIRDAQSSIENQYLDGKPPSRCYVRVADGSLLGRGQPGGFKLAMQDVEEMFCIELSEDPGHVTPEGAATLIEMYEEGSFELKRPSKGIGTPDELQAFAESRELLEAETRAEEKERQTPIKNPDRLDPEDFTWSLLNQVFRYHQEGTGGKETSLEIGDVTVHKSVTPYRSNSGKNTDWEVTFSWEDESGERHQLVDESEFKRNRRNDPDRNWGLPD